MAALVDTALLRNDKLYVLRMVNCGITCEGACRLARSMEAIGMMTSLKVLDLGCNQIADRGACALAAMLIGATSSVPLQTLELEGNMVSCRNTGCHSVGTCKQTWCHVVEASSAGGHWSCL